MSAAAKVNTQNEVAVREPQNGVLTPLEMLDRAVTSGATPDTLEKLMALQERWEKNQARKAFDNAMAQAKAEIPVIGKGRAVDFTTQKGRTNYKYEDLPGIAKVVDPILARYGLSYRYRTNVRDGGLIEVACVISHRDGHAEETMLTAGRDETGNKNNIQAVGSTITYLQRYTLKAALGLSASADDDAQASEYNPVSKEQLQKLIDLADEVGADKRVFCKYMGVDGLANIDAKDFDRAVAALEKKRKAS